MKPCLTRDLLREFRDLWQRYTAPSDDRRSTKLRGLNRKEVVQAIDELVALGDARCCHGRSVFGRRTARHARRPRLGAPSEHCAKALLRASLWEPGGIDPAERIVSPRRALQRVAVVAATIRRELQEARRAHRAAAEFGLLRLARRGRLLQASRRGTGCGGSLRWAGALAGRARAATWDDRRRRAGSLRDSDALRAARLPRTSRCRPAAAIEVHDELLVPLTDPAVGSDAERRGRSGSSARRTPGRHPRARRRSIAQPWPRLDTRERLHFLGQLVRRRQGAVTARAWTRMGARPGPSVACADRVDRLAATSTKGIVGHQGLTVGGSPATRRHCFDTLGHLGGVVSLRQKRCVRRSPSTPPPWAPTCTTAARDLGLSFVVVSP